MPCVSLFMKPIRNLYTLMHANRNVGSHVRSWPVFYGSLTLLKFVHSSYSFDQIVLELDKDMLDL